MPNHAQASALFILFAQPAAVFAHGGESFAVRQHVRKPPIVEIVEGLAQICDVYTHLRAREHIFFARKVIKVRLLPYTGAAGRHFPSGK